MLLSRQCKHARAPARYVDWTFSAAPDFIELFDLTRDPDQMVNLFGSRNVESAALDTGRRGYGDDDALVASLAAELRRQFACKGASCRTGDGDVNCVHSELTAALESSSRKYFDEHRNDYCDARRFPVYGYSKLGVLVNQALSGALALVVVLALGCCCVVQARGKRCSPAPLSKMGVVVKASSVWSTAAWGRDDRGGAWPYRAVACDEMPRCGAAGGGDAGGAKLSTCAGSGAAATAQQPKQVAAVVSKAALKAVAAASATATALETA